VRERNGKRETTWWPQFRVIDTTTVTPDPEVAAVVARHEAELSRELDVPIGTTAVQLDSRNATVRTGEAAIGDLFADAVRISTRSDAALLNGGGIRANRLYPPGTQITRRDILAELPFNNRVIVLEVSGRTLRQAIENGLLYLPHANGRFPQVSGMEVTYALARPPGARVISMRVAGSPLDEERMYRLATIDFLAAGGDSYSMLRDAHASRRSTTHR
jgi:5'-nucleotidase / UDP-sugar diphosphatase